jgi:sarcosine oxidase/L-pipecolate oxidase
MSKLHILIVGAGAWGASTAVALLQSGKYTVSLLDRAAVLPAEDAASTDINKIVRFDYQEEVYAELAFQALAEWRKKEWEGMYFE